MAAEDVGREVSYLVAEVKDIRLTKFRNGEAISLFPQFLHLDLYQSIHDPVMRAELVIHDPIALHAHFPIVGEQSILIQIKPTRIDLTDPNAITDRHDRISKSGWGNRDQMVELEFMIAGVRQMYPDDKARATIYVMELYSTPMYHNAKWRVQRAFKDGYHNAIKTVLKDYLAVPNELRYINDFNFEPARMTQFIVPNMKPFEAIMWMCKRAVPIDPKHFLYLFYETFWGFHFQTVQKLYERVAAHDYLYFSNMADEMRQQWATDSGVNRKSVDQRTITGLSLNNRHGTVEKFAAGFYENELYEIDIFNKRINSKKTEAKEDKAEHALEKGQLNTREYLKAAKINNQKDGTKTRVRYIVGQNNGDEPRNPYYFSDKFGDGVRSQAALSQISMTIGVPGDTRVQAGDILNIHLPEFHGFNQVEEDAYISGRYLITDIKHSLAAGMRHTMTANLHKDSYQKDIELAMKYKLGGYNGG